MHRRHLASSVPAWSSASSGGAPPAASPGGEVVVRERRASRDDLLADVGRLPGLGHRVPRVRVVERAAPARDVRMRSGRTEATRWARIAPQSWATRSTGSPKATSCAPRASRRTPPWWRSSRRAPALPKPGSASTSTSVRSSSAMQRAPHARRVGDAVDEDDGRGIRTAATRARCAAAGSPSRRARAARRASRSPARGARPGTSDVSRPRIPDGRVTRCQRITSRRRAAAPQAGQNTAWSSSSDRPPWRPSARLGA